jgi:hypothetical protein
MKDALFSSFILILVVVMALCSFRKPQDIAEK